MGQFIVKIRDRYLFWSTVVDAPVTYGMTLQGLRDYVREREGRRGLDELEQRLERVEKKGTSSRGDENADDTMWLMWLVGTRPRLPRCNSGRVTSRAESLRKVSATHTTKRVT